MFLRGIIFLTFVLAFPFSVTAQDAKQALNDKLYEATRSGNVADVKAALDQGADVNAKFRYGATALFKAAERGNVEVVKLLLERGADVNIKDTFYNATAMTWALDGGHVEVVRALLDKSTEGVDVVLMTGARTGNVGLVNVALAKGGAQPTSLSSALVAATEGEKKSAEIAELLTKAGALLPPKIAPEILQTYVGTYKAEAGPDIAITVKDGKLFAMATGQRAFVLAAIDKTSFRPAEFDGLTISFNLAGDKVTGLTLKQGTTTSPYKRVEDSK